MKEIKGVTHPIPTEYAERIYNEGKTVFVSKKLLGRVLKGDKFIIYESHGAQAYTSWADIKSIGKQKTSSINRKYGNKLMLTKKELKEYAKDRTEMNVIEFENLEKFKNHVKPKRFVSISGKYIYNDEYEEIISKKDW